MNWNRTADTDWLEFGPTPIKVVCVDAVITLLSPSYCASEENKNEFITSSWMRKKIIPIFTEKGFTGAGYDYVNLGIAGNLFYSIHDGATRKEIVESIVIRELG